MRTGVRGPETWAGGWSFTLLAVVGLLALVGCGNLTSGGVGEMEVVVASDEVVAQATEAPAAPEARVASTTGNLEGYLQLQVRAFVRRGTADWLEITQGRQEMQLDLRNPQPQELARRALPEGRYDRVRFRFERIEAMVTGGLVVDGDTITGPVRVVLGAEGRLTLTRALDLDVRNGQVASVFLDMKAERWLRRLNIAACRISDCRVEDEDFSEEVRIRARQP